jgi:hypothetical protein
MNLNEARQILKKNGYVLSEAKSKKIVYWDSNSDIIVMPYNKQVETACKKYPKVKTYKKNDFLVIDCGQYCTGGAFAANEVDLYDKYAAVKECMPADNSKYVDEDGKAVPANVSKLLAMYGQAYEQARNANNEPDEDIDIFQELYDGIYCHWLDSDASCSDLAEAFYHGMEDDIDWEDYSSYLEEEYRFKDIEYIEIAYQDGLDFSTCKSEKEIRAMLDDKLDY